MVAVLADVFLVLHMIAIVITLAIIIPIGASMVKELLK